MNVIFNRQVADQLRDRYLVLELETFTVGDRSLESFCVVDGDSIPLSELPTLKHYENLHQDLITALKGGHYSVCHELAGHLHGKFGGELDSFYEIIAQRFTTKE